MSVDKFGRHSYTGMTIDKFGRHSNTERLKGPKGEGFKLNQDGSYDMQNKRLTNLSDPLSESDGANLKTVKSHLGACLQLTDKNEFFDAQNKRIANVQGPENVGDVVTLKHFLSNTPLKLADNYVFDNHRISNVGKARYEGDAVNLKVLRENAVNKKEDGNWDCKEKRLTNVADPLDPNDVVTKSYLFDNIPVKSKKSYNFSSYKLRMIGHPEELSDAVNVEYMQKNSLIKSADSVFDAGSSRIKNTAKPQELDDVINKRYLKTVLSELGYELYKSVHKKERKRLTPPEEWKSKVLESTWEELFNN
jgi:hypothetical protein